MRVGISFLLGTILVASSGCNRTPAVNPPVPPGNPPVNVQGAETDDGKPPRPPLALAAPSAPAGVDKAPMPKLLASAKQAELKNDFKKAIQYQYAAVQQGASQYDLACYYGRDNDVNAALYWLQKGGIEEGMDADWASQDSDLDSVRRDPRWPALLAYLHQCSNYWAKHGQPATILLLPKGYTVDIDKAIPAVIGLHGMGDGPANFISNFQQDADDLNVAFVGVSGAVPRGKTKFVWSPETAKNAKRVDDAMQEIASRVKIKPGEVILLGFSQGAQAAAEIAVREPEKYAGAIILSPGGLPDPQPQAFAKKARSQGFVVSVNAKELPGNVALTKEYAGLLRDAGARVQHKEYPNVAQHSFPPDFFQVLPAWIDFVLQDRRKSP